MKMNSLRIKEEKKKYRDLKFFALLLIIQVRNFIQESIETKLWKCSIINFFHKIFLLLYIWIVY